METLENMVQDWLGKVRDYCGKSKVVREMCIKNYSSVFEGSLMQYFMLYNTACQSLSNLKYVVVNVALYAILNEYNLL